MQLLERHLQHARVELRHVRRRPIPRERLEVDVLVPQRVRQPVRAHVGQAALEQSADGFAVLPLIDGKAAVVRPEVHAVGYSGHPALVDSADARARKVGARQVAGGGIGGGGGGVTARPRAQPGLGVGVFLPIPVAEGKLGEKGIVHEAQLGKVVEPLGGSDELGPRREVGGVGPHGLPVRLRGAGPGGRGGGGGGGGGGSGGSSVSNGVYGDGGGVCVAGNVCCRRRPSVICVIHTPPRGR
mmetsp:Transcript_195/g.515  ORF Transcript_195/g.515 Transcript_195/m.515 type:complete len:242 (+) Transcript_195:165-890(+)